MDLWRETVVIAPNGGMCETTTPAVKLSRASAAVLAPVSIWFIVIMLTPAIYTSKTLSYMFVVIDDST